MAVEKMTENVEVVQTLSTYPNQEEGLSAEQLKAKFDQGPKALKEYLNNVLVPAVQGIQNAMDAGAQYGLDTTLSVPGRAADAAAVGTALAGKAPAGYGLGERETPRVDDINSATIPGFYGLNGTYVSNYPTEYPDIRYGTLLVERRGAQIHQTIRYGSIMATRQYGRNSLEWSEWEWVNPPMEQGIEYRTTERAWGRPVYKYLMYYGFLPNATEAGVNHGIDGMTQVIKVHLLPQGLKTQLDHNPQITKINVDAEKIYITTNSNLTSTRCYVLLEYCKD